MSSVSALVSLTASISSVSADTLIRIGREEKGRCKATWKRESKLPWSEDGSPNQPPPLGPCSRPVPRAPWGSYGRGLLLVGEVPLYKGDSQMRTRIVLGPYGNPSPKMNRSAAAQCTGSWSWIDLWTAALRALLGTRPT